MNAYILKLQLDLNDKSSLYVAKILAKYKTKQISEK